MEDGIISILETGWATTVEHLLRSDTLRGNAICPALFLLSKVVVIIALTHKIGYTVSNATVPFRPPPAEAMSENGQEGEKDYQVNMGFSGDKGYGATEPAPGDTSDTAKVVTATAAANKVARWL